MGIKYDKTCKSNHSCCYPLQYILTLLHSERPKLYTVLAFLSNIKSETETNIRRLFIWSNKEQDISKMKCRYVDAVPGVITLK